MNKINTRKALSPAYRKHKPLRKDVNLFTDELLACLKTIKTSEARDEHEEHYKDPIKVFLQNTFYKENYINTKDRIDLAIYTGKDANSDVGVIIEAKRPSNKAEFLTTENLNRKALQELLLYYLRERIENNNNNIKHLIATNGYEWFLFKSDDFYKYFFKNKALIKEYQAFRDGNKDSSKNELFYNEIAKKYIEKVENELPFVHLDFTKKSIKEYSDADLNTLFKIFSDVHILGNSFGNDSNQLNKSFYNELLHIIGLEETKDGGKKIINRKAEKERNYNSILENAIFIIEERDHLNNIKSVENGKNKAFDAGLELTLTWINRILFLKLLESQLLAYRNGAKEYRFLNSDFIKGYDDLNDLFFSALAKKQDERHPKFKDRFKYIPYLNSSLFEINTLESEAFEISALNHDEELVIFSQTVLKDPKGNRIKGKLKTLDYLFLFLDAYNFATDGTEGIEDGAETKTLINASVLGLIFEKINGYKEGSFYTPAYITMYMCKETLRRAVVQKFKEQENEQIETFADLQAYTRKSFKKEDLQKYNQIVNSLKIVDPAVGSGHFLVSALNELISIKNDLGILIDTDGLPLQSEILIENDELFITDKLGHLLDYKPENKETANIQKTLFHEKQNLIENCLFGVDIDPNSVKICRLRLWIELLKNAYYTADNQLQTLPNIDINIKAGNSLISRFDLKDQLKDAFKGKEVKYTFADYKNAVADYKNTNDKNRKHEIIEIISEVKNNFKSTLDKDIITTVQKAEADYNIEYQRLENLKAFGEKINKAETDKLKKLKDKADKAIAQKEETINNAIYHNAFEWRFEFPEVLDDNGNYVGFDVVIGNPPYVQLQSMGQTGKDYGKMNFKTYAATGDLYALFYEQGNNILKPKGLLNFITGSAWMRANYGKGLRNFFNSNTNPLQLIDLSDCEVFDSATVLTNIMFYEKSKFNNYTKAIRITRKDQHVLPLLEQYFNTNFIKMNSLPETSWIISDKQTYDIKQKVEQQGVKIIDWDIKINYGIKTGFNEAFIIDTKTKNELIAKDPKSIEVIKPLLRGRDIKKYAYDFNGLWLINIPKGYTIKTMQKLKQNIVKEPMPRYGYEEYDEAWEFIKTKYPALANYLKKHKTKASKRGDKGDYWWELRACAYLSDFDKPKIIYPNMTKFLPFTYDKSGYFTNQKCYILTGVKIEFIVSFLNSSLFRFCFEENFPELQGDTRELNKVIFEQIPVKEISEEQEQSFIEKVNQILELKKANPKADTSSLEKEIDQMVYALYELTDEEIAIIENSVK
ncbi:MAG: class I SAM-dependent DNA methyltransferase [Bacteroidales bacterium]|nr:class I SAM-dependent DNA methyltransferase [Bacteroidales bacterium]MBN2757817.1 class I SAM-dependent DNA methyltransferase [Bacteroidales bacterium]